MKYNPPHLCEDITKKVIAFTMDGSISGSVIYIIVIS